jgi:ATP-dependent exoDNAse (exonuclease V) beta subunit
LYVLATLYAIQKVVKQGFEYKDIVVLTRKRSQGIAVANYLTEQGIPLLSSETLMIKNATEVRFIIHLLKYLKNNSDKESKAYFLHYLAQNSQDKFPIHDFIAQGMGFVNEMDFENWLESFDVSLSFQNIRKKSLYEAVEIIVSKFLNLNKSNAYVQYFMDIVLERDIRNQAGISDFLNYWDKNSEKFSIPSPEGNNAVRIMTIHTSKGLEFPVVIMPFADEDYSRSPKNKLWIGTEVEDFGLPKVLVDNSKAVEGFGETAKAVYSQKSQEELLDNVNILYVALTRAEEQLYVISSMNLDAKGVARKNNMSAFFVNYLVNKELFEEDKFEYEFGNPTKLSVEKKHVDTSKTIPLVGEILDPKNIKIAQRESLMWGTHQQEAIEYGNVVHEILAFVKTKADVDLAITKAIESGLITMNQKEVVYKTIQEIVNHSELSNYFSEGNEVLNEQAIIQKQGKTIKPDRMVLTKNKEVFLLDYKTGTHNPKYQLQLENYQNAIELMGYKVVKKALIYIGEQINVVNL